MENYQDAMDIMEESWDSICQECRNVLSSELHYQAIMYGCFRNTGKVPIKQIGMNVKIRIFNPITSLFRELDNQKHKDYQGGYEPIPDIVLFSPAIDGDFRRRNRENTLKHMLMAIEVKASERENGRLMPGEIIRDLKKLKAFQNEASRRRSYFVPTMIIVDTAKEDDGRMRRNSLEEVAISAKKQNIGLFYLNPDIHEEWIWDITKLKQ